MSEPANDKSLEDRIENHDATVVHKNPYDVDIADFNLANPYLFSSDTQGGTGLRLPKSRVDVLQATAEQVVINEPAKGV